MINLFLDDLRDPSEVPGLPEVPWKVIRTAEEVMQILRTSEVQRISLDHDLGQTATGYDVAVWLEENLQLREFPGIPHEIYLHTRNPVGRQRMLAALRHFPVVRVL